MFKRFFIVLITIVIALSLMAGTTGKVTICHFAGLAGTDKYVTLTLAWQAVFGQAGHFYENGTPRAGHEQDYLGACREPTNTPTPRPENTATPTEIVNNTATPTEIVNNTPTPTPEGYVTPTPSGEITQVYYPSAPRPTPCPLCGTARVDEEALCSGRVGKNLNHIYNLFGKGTLYHVWSNSIFFYAENRLTGERVVSVANKTPAGVQYVLDTNWISFDIYAYDFGFGGTLIDDVCYREPCSVSGWSYVVDTTIQPYYPYNISEFETWFISDPFFKTFGEGWMYDDKGEAHDLAVLAMNSLRKGIPFDLAPYLK